MFITEKNHISTFQMVGINYKKTDAALRGKYAIKDQQYKSILSGAGDKGIDNLIVLSTCNRTEIYGFVENLNDVIQLLCEHTSTDIHELVSLLYTQNGEEAMDHLLHVATGLDSQILGDYEIIGQLRQSVKFARKNGFVNSSLDRVMNSVLNTAKKVRTHTRLSHGTISTSFAAVQCIKQHFSNTVGLNILLVGMGKIGQNTFKNLKDYIPGAHVTVINRSIEKLAGISGAPNLSLKAWHHLENEIRRAQVVLVATSLAEPIISPEHVAELPGFRLFIDLSIPFNISPEISQIENIKLLNIDELSRLSDKTFASRQAEVPKAKAIISAQLKELVEWHQMRRHISYINLMKEQMEHIAKMTSENADPSKCPYHYMHNMVNSMMVKLKENNNHGCIYLHTMHSFMSTVLN